MWVMRRIPTPKVSIGTPDNRDCGLFDNRESFVPTALKHCFRWTTPEYRKAIPSGNSRGYKIGRTSGTCVYVWVIRSDVSLVMAVLLIVFQIMIIVFIVFWSEVLEDYDNEREKKCAMAQSSWLFHYHPGRFFRL